MSNDITKVEIIEAKEAMEISDLWRAAQNDIEECDAKAREAYEKLREAILHAQAGEITSIELKNKVNREVSILDLAIGCINLAKVRITRAKKYDESLKKAANNALNLIKTDRGDLKRSELLTRDELYAIQLSSNVEKFCTALLARVEQIDKILRRVRANMNGEVHGRTIQAQFKFNVPLELSFAEEELKHLVPYLEQLVQRMESFRKVIFSLFFDLKNSILRSRNYRK